MSERNLTSALTLPTIARGRPASVPDAPARQTGRVSEPVLVRASVIADAAAIARVQVASWQAAYAGIVPAAHLAEMSAAERAARHEARLAAPPPRSGHWVAEEDGRICAFAAAGPNRDELEPALGELYALYVDPGSWGHGAGRALLGRALEFLVEQAFTAVTLWVLAENTRARRFYAAAGLLPDGAAKQIELGGPVREMRYRRDLPATP